MEWYEKRALNLKCSWKTGRLFEFSWVSIWFLTNLKIWCLVLLVFVIANLQGIRISLCFCPFHCPLFIPFFKISNFLFTLFFPSLTSYFSYFWCNACFLSLLSFNNMFTLWLFSYQIGWISQKILLSLCCGFFQYGHLPYCHSVIFDAIALLDLNSLNFMSAAECC